MDGKSLPEKDNSQQQNASTYQEVDQINRSSRIINSPVYGQSHYLATGVSSKGAWDPSPLKGISSYPPETDLVLEKFLSDYDEILEEISTSPVDERKPEHVKFLLNKALPHLETMIAKSGRTADILDIILRLSCVKECPVVTRYALHMILEALSKTSYDSGGIYNDFLLKCESCLRESLLDPSIFEHENAEDQGLRIFVYSRSLMILYANMVQGTIPLANVANTFEGLNVKICDLEGQMFFEEKDKPRYAIRCIKETIARISSIKEKRKRSEKSFFTFLKWLREYNAKGQENKVQRNDSAKHFLSKIKTSKNGWFDFHVAVFCLGSQIHEKSTNREVLRALIENYIKQHSVCRISWSSEREWQNGLVLGSVLEDITHYNHDRATRTLACLCLIYCFDKLRKRKSSAKTWLQGSLRRCLYGPNSDLREVILKHLEMKEERKEDIARDNLDENIPTTQSMAYLVHRYKMQILPSSLHSTKMDDKKGYFLVMFRGEKALVKILCITKGDFIRKERAVQRKIHQQLEEEAYTLRRLNSKPHPNILRVFAYDTSAQPCHLITEMVSEGSLLQYLHGLRSRADHMPVPSVLLEMMFGIMEAVIYLNEQHLVHLSLMAANVLVSHDNVCKLTGFQYVREMTRKGGGRHFAYVSGDDEMAIRHAAPECLENGHFSEKSVSWAIGILLFEMHTYGVSPYNQYSNDKADQIRSHVIGRCGLKMEDCIRGEVCDVIEICLTYEKDDRPSLEHLMKDLQTIQLQIIEEEKDCPAANYPALTNVDLAQTKNVMISCNELEKLDNEKNLGNFGSEEIATDRPTIRIFDGKKVIREIVSKEKADLGKLKYLKHENVVNVISLSDHDKMHVALVTEYSGLGNLLQTALAKRCSPDQLVTFVTQIAQGLRYLHDNNMIHGDLRAEYIMVFPKNKVKVSRLGRSKPRENLEKTKYSVPVDAKRWSPPEVIKGGTYSRCSDVYSYGLMCHELFEAIEAAEGSKPEDVKPFRAIADNKLLNHLEESNRPLRPNLMHIFLNIIIKMCLLDRPDKRPTFDAIIDALTSRKPFESYLLFQWKESNKREAEYINLNIIQDENATHVIAEEHHRTFEELQETVYDEIKEDPYEEIPAGGMCQYGRKLVLGFSELRPSTPHVKPKRGAQGSLRIWPTLPALPNSDEQDNHKDSIPSLSISDEPCSKAQVPSNSMPFSSPSVEKDVPVEELQYAENQVQEYISIASDNLATEHSWCTPAPEDNQKDGISSSKPPEPQEYTSMTGYDSRQYKEQKGRSSSNEIHNDQDYISMATNALGATKLTPKNVQQDWSPLSETADACEINNSKAKIPNNRRPNVRPPVPLPRTRLSKDK